MNARELALAVVRDVFAAEAHGAERGAQEALDYRLRRSTLSERDRAFATELAYGAIKMRRTLDWYLQPYVGERGKPLPPAIAEILRLGAYECLFTDAREHATVNELVALAKKYGHRGTAGLVNAVLRRILRERPQPPAREQFESEDEYLGVAYSFPTWIVRQFRTALGTSRLEAALAGCNAPAQGCVVVNRAVTSREAVAAWFAERGAVATPSPFALDALLVSGPALARGGERENGGAWWVQSETSAMAADVLNVQQGEAVLDVCSGRGNKALQSAARAGRDGSLTCIERDPRKAALLQERLTRAEFSAALVVGDATQPLLDARARFDRILVDAPCSGIGVVGRHPEARWRKSPQDGERLAEVQRALVERYLTHLHPGGSLVYAVCSVDPRETGEIVHWSERTQGAEREPVPARYEPLLTGAGDVLAPPGIEGRDGFFVARLGRGGAP